MSCVDGPSPPQLPALSGGVTLPSFQTPDFSGDVDECCHFSLFAIPPVNIGLPAIPGGAITAINADIASLDALLAAMDILHIDCPLDSD